MGAWHWKTSVSSLALSLVSYTAGEESLRLSCPHLHNGNSNNGNLYQQGPAEDSERECTGTKLDCQ